MAAGMESEVTIFERSVDRMRELDVSPGPDGHSLDVEPHAIEEELPRPTW